ncbi:MAG: hypothetical protein KKE89_09875, partial [Actinobacteria bacterium]|nr:hypothetical protein [Actinomycetota bacterium]
MHLHGDWSGSALDRDPVAADVGPFPRRGFLEVWRAHRGSGELLLADDGRVALPLWRGRGGIVIAGEEDLADYHCPLGGGLADLPSFGEALGAALTPGTRFRLDSLPGEVAVPLAEGLAAAGVAVAPIPHEAAAVLALPADYETYLGGLRAKDRHEIRRKRRRFTDALGEPHLVSGPDGFGAFVEMHRASEGPKGEFMGEEMAGFFEDLLGV